MKKFICGLAISISFFSNAQNILNATSPEEFRKLRAENKEKKPDSTTVSTKVEPFRYSFIEDKDILKSVMTWEIIDMNDLINQPFYYSHDGLTQNNNSLYDVLLNGALDGKITEVYDDENFTTKLTPEAIQKRLQSVRLADQAIDILNTGRQLTEEERRQYTDLVKLTTDRVKVLKIMGMWFIDKRNGELKYRPLGIAAMGQDPTTIGQGIAGGEELVDLFWIFYNDPKVRELLANNVAHNPGNMNDNVSYDDLINARKFSSVIYRSDLGNGRGIIKDYVPNDAEGQIDESDRIKGAIIAMENELWNY